MILDWATVLDNTICQEGMCLETVATSLPSHASKTREGSPKQASNTDSRQQSILKTKTLAETDIS